MVALTFVVIKSKARNEALFKSAKEFREQQERVNNYAMERQSKRDQKRPAAGRESQQQDKVVLVESSGEPL